MLPDWSRDEFDDAFNQLLEEGLIELAGINEDGQWLYKATEKGVAFYETAIQAGLGQILDSLERDVE